MSWLPDISKNGLEELFRARHPQPRSRSRSRCRSHGPQRRHHLLRALLRPFVALRGIARLLIRACNNKRVITISSFVGAGLYVWRTQRETVPYVRRKHTVLMPLTLERLLGRMVFEFVKATAAETNTALPETDRLVKRVKKIGDRLVEVATHLNEEGSCGHMAGLEWEFLVVRCSVVNAFVLPGGKVVVFTGLIELLSNEELAAVLAHEISHVIARHSAERFTELGFLTCVQLVLNSLCGLEVLPAFALKLFSLPHSRRAETEADVIGVHLMAKARFDPRAAVSMLKKLEALETLNGRQPAPAFLRTHPLASERVERVQQEIPAALTAFRSRSRVSRICRVFNPLRWMSG